MSSPLLQLFQHQASGGVRERLCTTLRLAINRHHLHAGQQLPSSRQLAQDLRISRVTVEAAYGQLESEGYLRREIGRGTFVAITIPAGTAPAARVQPARFSARGQQVLATGGCQDPPFPHAFAAGSPELRAFPHDSWRRLSSSVQRSLGSAAMGYGDPCGYLPLRSAIADYLVLSRGMQCQPEQVIILTSSQQALQLLAMMFVDPGDDVWIEEPGYPGARNALLAAGAKVHGITVDAEGAVPGHGSAKLMYLTPSHHYPTGVTLSLPRRLAWLAWAQRNQSWLIEDDYDSEFHYDERPIPALQGLDRHQRVITLGTFSKSLFPSLRLAWMVVPPALIAPLGQARSVLDGHSALLPQAITAAFLQQGHFATHLRLMRQLYHSRRDRLLEQIAQRLSPWITPIVSGGGLQLTVTVEQDEARLTALAAQQGLLLPRLSPLYAGSASQQGWILGFAALTPDEIVAGCDKLLRLLQREG
ncbi:PLP-dependent aminotransferase family protein [Pantoea sp. EKM101V]|uniref:MocR-like pyridoxine biosynthesis transcription factor PdxR n=1 Tax=Pantoea sp. EKM101V TaxID=1683695 RepID=UPI00142E5965|nr:PLP-dependent aminotransferase family protein [Pantoea sp. EKM101V]KAF6665702.1 PLP-dependent aminotransferase family protein [Pantoea sp. EKM101V]